MLANHMIASHMPASQHLSQHDEGHVLAVSPSIHPTTGIHEELIAMVGTSDCPCWLAEACKLLLLLLQFYHRP